LSPSFEITYLRVGERHITKLRELVLGI
jgi:hypothetical protein